MATYWHAISAALVRSLEHVLCTYIHSTWRSFGQDLVQSAVITFEVPRQVSVREQDEPSIFHSNANTGRGD